MEGWLVAVMGMQLSWEFELFVANCKALGETKSSVVKTARFIG